MTSAGQSSKPKMKCDSLFILTENEFAKIVTSSLKLLEGKKLSQISDDQHRTIIRAYNRIWISQLQNPVYLSGDYAKLKKLLDKPSYSENMLKIYPSWIPNRGMGMYFVKLNIEYGGTPCS